MDITKILAMAGNMEHRAVCQSQKGATFVSTAEVYDGAQPFETAIETPERNGGKMVIVEAYDTREAASDGHARWIAAIDAGALPNPLVDVANSECAQLLRQLEDGIN